MSVKGVKLICPPGAVDDPVTIKLILEETYKYCSLIVNHRLENDLKFGAPIINCQPNGQMFKKHVKFVIAVDSERENSTEAFLVLHGTPSESGKIHWEDITRNSKFDMENKELSVNIDHFSLIAVLVRLAWVQTKEIATRLNLISFKYMLSVLCKRSRPNLPYDELAFVFMSRDIYREQFYREHDDCALMKLKRDGFEELCSKVRMESSFIYNNETCRFQFTWEKITDRPATSKNESHLSWTLPFGGVLGMLSGYHCRLLVLTPKFCVEGLLLKASIVMLKKITSANKVSFTFKTLP